VHCILDQELISYRYSSCCCSCCCWGDCLQKALGCVISNRIGMEFSQECYSCKYTSIDCWIFTLISHFQDGDHDIISCRKMLSPGESTRSVCPAPMQQCKQFLIYSIFILVILHHKIYHRPIHISITCWCCVDWTEISTIELPLTDSLGECIELERLFLVFRHCNDIIIYKAHNVSRAECICRTMQCVVMGNFSHWSDIVSELLTGINIDLLNEHFHNCVGL